MDLGSRDHSGDLGGPEASWKIPSTQVSVCVCVCVCVKERERYTAEILIWVIYSSTGWIHQEEVNLCVY